MRYLLLSSVFIVLLGCSLHPDPMSEFAVSATAPYGLPNPEEPVQILDYEEMIGDCNCISVRRNTDGSWQDTLTMVWRFKYILNGSAIQDETWKSDSTYATSIRQYDPKTQQWVVSYYSNSVVGNVPGIWYGNRGGDSIILDKDQPSPTGLPGISRLSFHDISNAGFKWTGSWVDSAETITYPFWKIECQKR